MERGEKGVNGEWRNGKLQRPKCRYIQKRSEQDIKAAKYDQILQKDQHFRSVGVKALEMFLNLSLNQESYLDQPVLKKRQAAFKKIKRFFQTYQEQNISIFQYGSESCDMQSRNSDINISISTENRTSIMKLFQGITQNLGLQNFVHKCYIKKDKRPSVQIQIDSNKLDQIQYEQQEIFQIVQPNEIIHCNLILNNHKFNNYRIRSSFIIQRSLKKNPLLRQLIIILRTILVKSGFYNKKTGGISFYILFLMAASLTKEEKLDLKTISLGNLLRIFLQFYGCRFNRESTVIYWNKCISCFMSVEEFKSIINNMKDIIYIRPQQFIIDLNLPFYIFDPISKEMINSTFSKIERIFFLFRNMKMIIDSMELSCQYNFRLKFHFYKFHNEGQISQDELSKLLYSLFCETANANYIAHYYSFYRSYFVSLKDL